MNDVSSVPKVGVWAWSFVGFVLATAIVANYPQAYPLWNLLIVALNIVVLYALTARWEGFKASLG